MKYVVPIHAHLVVEATDPVEAAIQAEAEITAGPISETLTLSVVGIGTEYAPKLVNRA